MGDTEAYKAAAEAKEIAVAARNDISRIEEVFADKHQTIKSEVSRLITLVEKTEVKYEGHEDKMWKEIRKYRDDVTDMELAMTKEMNAICSMINKRFIGGLIAIIMVGASAFSGLFFMLEDAKKDVHASIEQRIGK